MNLRQLSRVSVNNIKDGLEDIESQDPLLDLNTSITLDETTAEADSQAESLNEDRWNPSWDVAEDDLAEVCCKQGLVGYDDEVMAAPESYIFYISTED